MSDAKVRISAVEGTFEIEGSETFVTQVLERFETPMQAAFARANSQASNGNSHASSAKPNGASNTPVVVVDADLSDIFAATDNEGVQILKDIPGESKPVKTTNAAKLLLHGLQALKSRDTASFDEVRDVCKKHGFLDESNMSSYLRGDRESFVIGGSTRKKTLKLTIPGAKAAAALVTQLKAGS